MMRMLQMTQLILYILLFLYHFQHLVISQNLWYNQAVRKEVTDMANKKQTSKSVASKASKILRDGRYSKTSKSVAGSALSQTKK